MTTIITTEPPQDVAPNDAVAPNDVMALRAMSGVGVMKCKKLLEKSGTVAAAAEIIKESGGTVDGSQRPNRTGTIGVYFHQIGGNDAPITFAAIVELACETAFVARTSEFRDFAKSLAVQVGSMNPLRIGIEDYDDDERALMRTTQYHALIADPNIFCDTDAMFERLVEAKVDETLRDQCLLDQPSVFVDKVPLRVGLEAIRISLRENIQVKRFTRFAVGD